MMRRLLFPMMLGFAVLAGPVAAQEDEDNQDQQQGESSSSDTTGPRRFWQANLDGGHYMVAIDRISSVSRHSYVLDGAVIVDEVTVDTLGQALARFYFLRPVTGELPGSAAGRLTDRGRELLDQAGRRAGTDVHNMVMKKYPETTHARTVEYRLMSEQELTGLYNSLKSAWESGRGRVFTAK